MTKPFCKKCLLEDMDFDEINQSILDYIKEIPEHKRVDENTYKKRLEICQSCESLVNGMCAKCGCYVELRALKPQMYCASEDKKW